MRINEVESSGGSPGDWVELYNAGTGTADLSGWVFKDNDDSHSYVIPANTKIQAGGYLMLEEADFGFGLGSADAARLFDATGTHLVDSYSWTAHATTTYGRCPNGTGNFTTTASVTKGTANDCATGGGSSDAGTGPSVTCPYDSTTNGTAALLGIYTLPSTSLQVLNPYLTQTDLDNAISNGAGTVTAPGIGSGLEYLGGCPGTFAMITDRGPNGNAPNGGVSFPLPNFTPAVATVHLDSSTQNIAIDSALPILDNSGKPVTGISNDATCDTPYLTSTSTTPLPYNQDGLDTEDVRRLPNGDLAFVEEYSPSAGIIDGTTGHVKVRYTPAGVILPSANYPVKPILPAVLKNRRSNKGFEGLALSPDGHTAFLVLQTPMGDEGTTGNSRANRVIRVDSFDDPANASVGGHFISVHSPASDYSDSDQTKVYYNSAAWMSAAKILLLERDNGILKLFVADFATATNLVGQPAKGETSLSPEIAANVTDLRALLTPATTTEVFTSVDTPNFITSPPFGAPSPNKLEGLAIINAATVAITNDNDFGISNPADPTRIWILRLKAPLSM